jgi:hypothetical protein
MNSSASSGATGGVAAAAAIGCLVCLLLSPMSAWADQLAAQVLAAQVLAAQVDEPRAYGWRVGDVVHRVVHVQVPAG